MIRKTLTTLVLTSALLLIGAGQAMAATVNINAPEWLGSLKLSKEELQKIRDAVEKALTAPIDETFQCGKVRQDCEVREAREWTVDGDTYREIVVYLHTRGHSSRTVAQSKGKWPKIVVK